MISMAALTKLAIPMAITHVDDLEAVQAAQLGLVPDHDAPLRQRRMQKNRMRHDRGAENARRPAARFRHRQNCGTNGVVQRPAPDRADR